LDIPSLTLQVLSAKLADGNIKFPARHVELALQDVFLLIRSRVDTKKTRSALLNGHCEKRLMLFAMCGSICRCQRLHLSKKHAD
jgi:hypothetical protein